MLRFWSGEQWTDHRSPEHAHMSGTPWRSFSEWFARSFTVAKNRSADSMIISLLLGFPALVLLFGTFFWAFDPVVINRNCDISGISATRLIVLGLAVLVSSLLYGLSQLALSRQMQLGWMNQAEPWSATLSRCVPRLPGLVAVYLAVIFAIIGAAGLVVVLAVAVHPALLLLFLVVVPVVIWASIALAFLPVTAAVAPAGTPLMKTTLAVTKDRWWSAFGRLLALGIVLSILSSILDVITGLLIPGDDGMAGVLAEFETNNEGSSLVCSPVLFADELPSTSLMLIGVAITAITYAIVALPYAAGLSGFYLDAGGPSDPAPGSSTEGSTT